MKKFLVALICFISLAFNAGAEYPNYLTVTYFGNDSEHLIATVRIDESLKAKVEKRPVKDASSDRMEEHNVLMLAGKEFVATCDLDRIEAWGFTDADLKIIAISEKLPYGYEMQWYTLKEQNGKFTIETDGREVYITTFASPDERFPEKEIKLNKYQTYSFDFTGPIGKIGYGLTDFIVRRKR